MAERGANVVTMPAGAKVHSAGSLLVAAWPIIGFAALTALAAQVKVPLPWTDVPMTLQSLAVLLAGLALSPAASAAAMVLYLCGGAAGLPVFTPGSQGLVGPTGGYIVGFVAAAWTIAMLRGGSNASAVRLGFAALGGMGVLFTCGTGGRTIWALAHGIDPKLAMATGLLPFIPKALIEIGLAVSLVTATRGFRERRISAAR
jgi:biotin transport system substrate-specific component